MGTGTAPGLPATTLQEPMFDRVLCGVDGSGAALEAARQAVKLAGSRGHVHFVNVAALDVAPLEAKRRTQRSHEALDGALAVAAESGVPATSATVASEHPAAVLLDTPDQHLIVVAGRAYGRTKGILLGSTATEVLHRATVPVLLARPAAPGNSFPDPIFVASDGSDGACAAARLAGRIGTVFQAPVGLITIEHNSYERPRLARSAVEVMTSTRTEPVYIVRSGSPPHEIPEILAAERASLAVLGSRGLTGIRALGSVSERVAHDAPCSVLVVGTRSGSTT